MFAAETFLDASLLPALLIAMSAGVLSFLSPCVLPIVPPYLAYMGGVSLSDMGEGDAASRRKALGAALFFVLGLSTIFLLLGAAASGLGRMLLAYQDWMLTIAGVVIIGFGLHFLGLYRVAFMDREMRVDAGDRGGSAVGAYVLGLAFAFGWTPCLGPILGAILGLAATEADIGRGVTMLAAYAVGLGIPFLLVAAYFPRLTGVMGWMKRHMGTIEKTSGGLLVLVGVMMITGQFTAFSYWLLEAFPALATLG
ncbi:MAG: cytochrome c biogenesis protein CcdA [Salibaculum sp.]|jgi:cytochrome c-type biogenesis protein|uniref:cytochrome c biogenesis CcdA family protein n=1 Tax=Roseovarius halophilus (ex Wu et al. 2025) TaxID=3376060 RepID=UPI0028707922|nr:cytochrome c biogenesis protein CcdA [Salibaculum sp.]MDR9427009.1 cytochrome c biogenesis protein CcdA [Salibaculum sp.]MDR9482956.1 cytochrome c biogenesis protein CcdA [Salibaculum sp.]